MGINPSTSSLIAFGLSHGDQRGPDHPVVQAVTLLQHVDYRVRFLVRREHADRLVPVGIELLPDGLISLRLALANTVFNCFNVRSTPLLSVSSAAESAARVASRLSLTGRRSAAMASTAYLYAFVSSIAVRFRIFSASALALSQASWCSWAFNSARRNSSSVSGKGATSAGAAGSTEVSSEGPCGLGWSGSGISSPQDLSPTLQGYKCAQSTT